MQLPTKRTVTRTTRTYSPYPIPVSPEAPHGLFATYLAHRNGAPAVDDDAEDAADKTHEAAPPAAPAHVAAQPSAVVGNAALAAATRALPPCSRQTLRVPRSMALPTTMLRRLNVVLAAIRCPAALALELVLAHSSCASTWLRTGKEGLRRCAAFCGARVLRAQTSSSTLYKSSYSRFLNQLCGSFSCNCTICKPIVCFAMV